MLIRMGVRSRLLLSFIGISGFAVLAAGAAIYSFVEVRKVLDTITEKRVPVALAAQELSSRVERVVAGAPALLQAGTPRAQTDIWNRLGNETKEIDAQLALLRRHVADADALRPLESALMPLRDNLLSLNTLAGERIVLADRKAGLLAELQKASNETQGILGSWTKQINDDVELLRGVAENSAAAETRLVAQTDWMASATQLVSLQHMQQAIAEAHGNLVEMARAEDSERLDQLGRRASWSMAVLKNLATAIKANPTPLQLAEHESILAHVEIERIRRYAEGDNSIAVLRSEELELLSEGEKVLAENAQLSSDLTRAVASLVQGTRQDIAHETSQARAVQTSSTITLIVVVVLSLVCSILIIWLYVDRNLIARLTALSRSMLAIADGNLETSLPAAGRDEIGRMAKALAIFRDTAVEVKKNNLREITEARRRLIAAIESISEGFSLYDADDRLVICNSNYTKIMYSGIEDAVTPGMSFEAVIRKAAERGLVGDAEGRVEEWVAERLARHRGPGGSHLQRRGDRWILISERKTEDGSTVAVYADITELKQRENQLSDKSRALEQLSNQLAKYLSPQVYESIFTGKQEVKIASRRKKLTVFFSDIAGFTETTERLESEDLTRLLNHYLTEMSEIANSYGATIDKYVGDAIVIFFGDPETRGVNEDALACVEMAIAMRKKMHELQDVWRASGIEKPLRCRIGINTGYCTVGNFGSEDRMDYTIVGGGVNLASRLEAAATPGEILISYETYANVRHRIHCEERGQISVKGIAYPVATYQVVDTYENLGTERLFIHEERPNLRLDLKLDAMSADDRDDAATVLREALNRLSALDRAITPEPQETK
jgi:class 3 adenylate cyclase/HAMP domain-containing protein